MIKVSGLQPAASSIKIPLQKSFQEGTTVEELQDHKVSNWYSAKGGCSNANSLFQYAC